eukprot:3655767-Prymnesium_polylepis.1
MFGHLAFASTSSKKYEKTAQKSPARVVYVVLREPRPEASVAVRSERTSLLGEAPGGWCAPKRSATIGVGHEKK